MTWHRHAAPGNAVGKREKIWFGDAVATRYRAGHHH